MRNKVIPGQKWVSTVAPFCTFLRIRNWAKTRDAHFVWEKSRPFILFFTFIISTELKEIRDFGSTLPNGIVERQDFGSMLPNGIVERRETKS